MPERVTHPTPQELNAFGLGKLPVEAAATVASHLETCATCRRVVDENPADSFLGKVRAAKPGGTALPRAPANARAPAVVSAIQVPPADLPPELAHHPKYRILRELGRGGMGVVYQARQTVMDRQVVIKVITPSLLANADALNRFHREVQAAAKLSHPNIVAAYDAEQAGDLHLLVMEFVPGLTLAEVVHQKGPLPVAYACHYVRQAALGLQHAFEQGMVHRDIKPHNLMLTPKGQVKVLDFGLARLRGAGPRVGTLTDAGAFMGTPEYVAPEQATDARMADIRADLYGLGCTLYFLLTGRPPFVADTVVKLLLAHIEKDPAPLQQLRPDVPEGLSAVMGRLLAKDPAKRFQTPVELAQALLPFIKADGQGTPVPVRSPPQGVASPVRGTMMGSETSRTGKPRRGGGQKVPAAQLDASDSFASLAAAEANEAAPTNQRTTASYKVRLPWLIGTAAALVLVALVSFWAGGGFTGKNHAASSLTSLPADVPNAVPRPPIAAAPFDAAKAKELQLAWAKYLNTPVEEEVDLGEGVKMAMVLIPPGKFQMGSPEDERRRDDDDEEYQHAVEIIKPFCIGKFLVTRAQFRRFVADDQYETDAEIARNNNTNKSTWLNPGFDQTDEHPVVNVSWNDAKAFCAWLSKKTGKSFRLPTEAEWEYSCRAGTTTRYYNGDDEQQLSEVARYGMNPEEGTAPVGRLRPNAFGLYDMLGNVWQWCQDWWGERYYQDGPSREPTGPAAGSLRVNRGGSFASSPEYCRAAHRDKNEPDHFYFCAGFRVVCTGPFILAPPSEQE